MSTTYQADPDVMHTDLGDELVLVHGRSGHSYRLNTTARFAWLQLPTTVEKLAEALTQQFEVDDATSAADAARLLQNLVDQGLARQAT